MLCSSLRKHNLNSIIVLAWKCTSVHFLASGLNNSFRNLTNVRPTILDLQKEWVSRFDSNNISEPSSSIKYIIEHVLGMTKGYEYNLNLNTEVTEEQEKQIRNLCECRLARMPVQYIMKEWDFRELHLAMCPPVFIPRPETEQLIDLIVDAVPANSVFLEIGCGSGAISLSLLKALPKARVVAIDQSKMACQLTVKNARQNDLTTNLEVIHSKLQEDGSLTEPLPVDQVDVLVSNPPYISSAQMLDLQPEIKIYEDLRALEAGPDGLRVIKSLFLLTQSVLKSGGLIFLEVDSSHPKLIKKWITERPELNIKFVKTFKDYCDRDRFVKLKKL